MRYRLSLVALVLTTVSASPGAAQKGGGLPPPSKLTDPHAKLDELISGIVKKQDEQAAILKRELEKGSLKMQATVQQAVAKAGVDIESPRIDLEAASKEVDAAVRRKRLSDALTKHGARLAAAAAIAKPLVGPMLDGLPRLTPATVVPVQTGWITVGTPPASPSSPHTYERSFGASSDSRATSRTKQDQSTVHEFVEVFFGQDKATRGGFEQSFTVPAGVKSFEVSARLVVQGQAYSVVGIVGYAFAEVRAFLAATGPGDQCTIDQQLWEHRGVLFDYFSGSIGTLTATLTCRIDRVNPVIGATYWIAAGASQRAGVGGGAAVGVDTDGAIPGVSSAGVHEIRVDALQWRVLSN
ncbi:MAG: hypothetical protein ABI193_03565 [Minicystis sp.]